MISIELLREKPTKNTVRYSEAEEPGQIGKLYVPNATVEALGNPEKLTITLDRAA